MESMKKCNVSKMWGSKMPEGLDLEVTNHPISMKSVVNLIIAMERLKGSGEESLRSTEFSDEQLVSIMLESVMEEYIVPEVETVPSVEYSRGCERQCSVTDSEQRNLVMVPNSMELHAVMLQGGTRGSRVHLSMATYLENEPNTEARTVALGIKGTNYYLSCHKDGDGEPTLHLEEVNKSTLATISSDSNMMRFLFYQYESGLNHSTFVSVRYNNWYISTAQGNNKPVALCLESASRHRTFTITAATCDSPTGCPVINC